MNHLIPNRGRSLYRAVWPLALIAIIFWGSGTKGPSSPSWMLSIPHVDKWAHFFVFGLIATLIYRALPHWLNRWHAMLFAIILTSLFGFADEFRQSLNPYRYMEFMDWVADTLGACVAVYVYSRWPFYRNLLELPLNPFKRIRHGGRYRSQTYPGITPDHHPAR